MLCGLLRSIGLMKPKVMSIDVSPQAIAKFEERMKEPGIFTFHEDGFTLAFRSGSKTVRWDDVERLVGYKHDDLTTDMICLDVEHGNTCFTITEDTDGWFVFLDRTMAAFPNIPKNWEVDVAQPAFATNLTVLYDRKAPR